MPFDRPREVYQRGAEAPLERPRSARMGLAARRGAETVGGVRYATTPPTPMRYPKSMLGRMFGSDIPSSTDQEGAFIDRDGHLFRYILDFLRKGNLSLPDNFSELDALQDEADFYEIAELISLL